MTNPTNGKRREEEKERRRRRQGFGMERSLKLHVPDDSKDPNYVYRWVNDDGRRVRQLTEMDDWDLVSDEKIAESDRQAGLGTRAERVVGKTEQGAGQRAYLLRKRRDWYEADKKEEQKALVDVERKMAKGRHEGAEALDPQHAYVPGGMNSIRTVADS